MQRFAKAIAPSVLALLGVVANWAASGKFDRTELVMAGLGLVTSAVVYFVPNAKETNV